MTARDTAAAMMAEQGVIGEPRRVIDTDYGALAYIVIPGVIVYEDEPDTWVSVEQREGRFVDA